MDSGLPRQEGAASPLTRLEQAARSRVLAPILEQITQGLSADTIALTVAVGLCIAIIPIIGVTTALSFLAAWALRLNQPIIQAVNWTSYPLQLLMILPFIRLGEKLFRAPRMRFSLEQLVAMARADPLATVRVLGATFGHAAVAWFLCAPIIVGTVYLVLRPLMQTLAKRLRAAREAGA
ncbi:MAG TPA: DUF2062 domain-containing protein [Thermoanaerobaculia bacterium]|jgi:hypothetical protein|nr:DUF2062 domain-containing protein [Thermoanaerobaculia bacterium]